MSKLSFSISPCTFPPKNILHGRWERVVCLTCNTSETYHGLTVPSRLLKLRSRGTETQLPRGEVPAVVPARGLWLRAVSAWEVLAQTTSHSIACFPQWLRSRFLRQAGTRSPKPPEWGSFSAALMPCWCIVSPPSGRSRGGSAAGGVVRGSRAACRPAG